MKPPVPERSESRPAQLTPAVLQRDQFNGLGWDALGKQVSYAGEPGGVVCAHEPGGMRPAVEAVAAAAHST